MSKPVIMLYTFHNSKSLLLTQNENGKGSNLKGKKNPDERNIHIQNLHNNKDENLLKRKIISFPYYILFYKFIHYILLQKIKLVLCDLFLTCFIALVFYLVTYVTCMSTYSTLEAVLVVNDTIQIFISSYVLHQGLVESDQQFSIWFNLLSR